MFGDLCNALGLPVNKEMSKIEQLIKCIINLPGYMISALITTLVTMTVTPYAREIQNINESLSNGLQSVSNKIEKFRKMIERLKKFLEGVKRAFKAGFKALKGIVQFLFNFASPITWIAWILIFLLVLLTVVGILLGRYGTYQGELTINVNEMRALNQQENEYTDLLNEAALRQSFYESVSDSSFYQAFSLNDYDGHSVSLSDAITNSFAKMAGEKETDDRVQKLKLKFGTDVKPSGSFIKDLLGIYGVTLPALDERSVLSDANALKANYLMQSEALGTYADSFGMTSYFRDYWGREENFMLTPELLYELNRWVYGNDFALDSTGKIIYPEAFAQPVAYVYDYCRIATDPYSLDYGNPYVYITQRVTLDDIKNPGSPYYGWNAYEGVIISEPSDIVYDYAVITKSAGVAGNVSRYATESTVIRYEDGTIDQTETLIRLYWKVKPEYADQQMNLNSVPADIFDGPYYGLTKAADGSLTFSGKLDGDNPSVVLNGVTVNLEDNLVPSRHYQLVSVTGEDGEIQLSSRNLFNKSFVKVPVVIDSYRNSDEYWDGFDEFIAEDVQKLPYNPIPTVDCTYEVDGVMCVCVVDENAVGGIGGIPEPDDWTKKKGSVVLYHFGISDCIHTIDTIVDNIRGEGAGAIEEADAEVIVAILLEYENYLCSYGTEGVQWEYAYHTYTASEEKDTVNSFHTGANIFKHMDNKKDQTRYVATYDAAVNLSSLSTLSTEYASVGVSSCLNDPDGEVWGWKAVIRNGIPVGLKKVYGEISYEFPEYYTNEQGKTWIEGTWRKAYDIENSFVAWPSPTNMVTVPAVNKDAYEASIPKQWQYGGYNFVNKWQKNGSKYTLAETGTGVNWTEWKKYLSTTLTLLDKYDLAMRSIPSIAEDERLEGVEAYRVLYDTRNEDEAWNPDVVVYRPDASADGKTAVMKASEGEQSGRVTTQDSATDYLAMELKSVRDYGLGSVLSYLEARKVTFISGIAVTEAQDNDAIDKWFDSYYGSIAGITDKQKQALVAAAKKGCYASSLLSRTASVDGEQVTLESVLCGKAYIELKNGNKWIPASDKGLTLNEKDLKKIADGLNSKQNTGSSIYSYGGNQYTVTYAAEADDINTAVDGGYIVMVKIGDKWYPTNMHAVIPYLQGSFLSESAAKVDAAFQRLLAVFGWNKEYTDADAAKEADNQFFNPLAYYNLWYDFIEDAQDTDDKSLADKLIENATHLCRSKGLVSTYDNSTVQKLREAINNMAVSGLSGPDTTAEGNEFTRWLSGIWSAMFPDTSAGQYVTSDQLRLVQKRFGNYLNPIDIVDPTQTGEIYLIEEAVTFLGNFLYTYDTQLLIAGDINNENRILSGVTYADRYTSLSHYIFKVPVSVDALRVTPTLYKATQTMNVGNVQSLLKIEKEAAQAYINNPSLLLEEPAFQELTAGTDPAFADGMLADAISQTGLSNSKKSVLRVFCISNVEIQKNDNKIEWRWAYRYGIFYASDTAKAKNTDRFICLDTALEIEKVCRELYNTHPDTALKLLIGTRIYDEDVIDISDIGQDYSYVNEHGELIDLISRNEDQYPWAVIDVIDAKYADYGRVDGTYGKLADINKKIQKLAEGRLTFTTDDDAYVVRGVLSIPIDSDGNYDDMAVETDVYTFEKALSLLTEAEMQYVADAVKAVYGQTYTASAYYSQTNDIPDVGSTASTWTEFYPSDSENISFGLAKGSKWTNAVWNTVAPGKKTEVHNLDGSFTHDLDAAYTVNIHYASQCIPNFFKVITNVTVSGNKVTLGTVNTTRYKSYYYYTYSLNTLNGSDILVGVSAANRQNYGTVLPTFTGLYGSKIQIGPKQTGSYFNEEVYSSWTTRLEDDGSYAKQDYLYKYRDDRMEYLYEYLLDFETYLPLSVMSDADLKERGIDTYRSVTANTNTPLEYTEHYIDLIRSRLTTASWNNIYAGYVVASAGISGFDVDSSFTLASGISADKYLINEDSMAQLIAGLIESVYEYGPYRMIEYENLTRQTEKIEHNVANYEVIRIAMMDSMMLNPDAGIQYVELTTESDTTVRVPLMYAGYGAIQCLNTATLKTDDTASGVVGFNDLSLRVSANRDDRLDAEKAIDYMTVRFGKLLYRYGNISSAIMAYTYGEEYWDAMLLEARVNGESTGPEWSTDNPDLIEGAIARMYHDSSVSERNGLFHPDTAFITDVTDNSLSNYYTSEIIEYALCYVSDPTVRLRMIRLTTSSLGTAAANVGRRASFAADLYTRWEDNPFYQGRVSVYQNGELLTDFEHLTSWSDVDVYAQEYGVDIGIVMALAMEASQGNPYFGLFDASYESGGGGADWHLAAVNGKGAWDNGFGMFALPNGIYSVGTVHNTIIDLASLDMAHPADIKTKDVSASFGIHRAYTPNDEECGIRDIDGTLIGKTAKGKKQDLKSTADFNDDEDLASAYVDALERWLKDSDFRFTDENDMLVSSGREVRIPTSAKYVVLRLAELHQTYERDLLKILYNYFYGIYGNVKGSGFELSLNELMRAASDNGYGTNWFMYYNSIVTVNRITSVLEYYDASLATDVETSVSQSKNYHSSTEIAVNEENTFSTADYAVLYTKSVQSIPTNGYAVTDLARGKTITIHNAPLDYAGLQTVYLGTMQSYVFAPDDNEDLRQILASLEGNPPETVSYNVRSTQFLSDHWEFWKADGTAEPSGIESVVGSIPEITIHRTADYSTAPVVYHLNQYNLAAQSRLRLPYFVSSAGYADTWRYQIDFTNVTIPQAEQIEEYYRHYVSNGQLPKVSGTEYTPGMFPSGTAVDVTTVKESSAYAYGVIVAISNPGDRQAKLYHEVLRYITDAQSPDELLQRDVTIKIETDIGRGKREYNGRIIAVYDPTNKSATHSPVLTDWAIGSSYASTDVWPNIIGGYDESTLSDADRVLLAAINEWGAAVETVTLKTIRVSIRADVDNPHHTLFCPSGSMPDIGDALSIKQLVDTISNLQNGSRSIIKMGEVKNDRLYGDLTLRYDVQNRRPVSGPDDIRTGERFVCSGYDVSADCSWHFIRNTAWNIVSNGYSMTSAGLFSDTSAFNQYKQDRMAEYVSGITVFDKSPFSNRKDVDLAIMSASADADDPFKSLYDYSLLHFFVAERSAVKKEEARSWMAVTCHTVERPSPSETIVSKVRLTSMGDSSPNESSMNDYSDFPPLARVSSASVYDASHILTHYGVSENPLSGGTQVVRGIELQAEYDSFLPALLDGVVVESGYDMVYGNYTVVEYSLSAVGVADEDLFPLLSSANGDRYEIKSLHVVYGYLQDSLPEIGTLVQKGQSIRTSNQAHADHVRIGIGGNSCGNRLYLELRVEAVMLDSNDEPISAFVRLPVDPEPYLTCTWNVTR